MRSMLLGCLLFALLATSCKRHGASGDTPTVVVGAGATLPSPLYDRWATEYGRIRPEARIDYHAVGSGAGLRQLTDGVVDFGATDEPLAADSATRARAKPLVYVPTTLGAVAIVFAASGTTELRLTPELVADIFLGKITRWEDPALARENGGALPSGPITVVHRADGSGTTAALTSFLAKSSADWERRVGVGTAARFPVGAGMRGNSGVASFVKATPQSIGYVELTFARQAGLASAAIKNTRGRFVAPTKEALDRAARLGAEGNDDAGAYPIAAVSFVVVKNDAADRAKAEAVARFLWWAVHDGQRLAPELDYAPLTTELLTSAERALRGIRAGGKPILTAEGGG